jgi:hypothetical protein
MVLPSALKTFGSLKVGKSTKKALASRKSNSPLHTNGYHTYLRKTQCSKHRQDRYSFQTVSKPTITKRKCMRKTSSNGRKLALSDTLDNFDFLTKCTGIFSPAACTS